MMGWEREREKRALPDFFGQAGQRLPFDSFMREGIFCGEVETAKSELSIRRKNCARERGQSAPRDHRATATV